MGIFTTILIGLSAYAVGYRTGTHTASGPAPTLDQVLQELQTRGILTAVDAQAIRTAVAAGRANPGQVLADLVAMI